MENNLKTFRLKKKKSQREICEEVGIKTTQEYSKIELGKVIPRVDRAIKIARVLRKRVEDIWAVPIK